MLKGKTTLVTGSTSGIGLGIAKALAKQGANIVLNGFGDVEGPKAEIAAVAAPGVKVGYHGADMSKASEIADMMAYAASTFGRVDILVNNAGIQHVAKIEDFPIEKWDAIIAINLSSAFHATRLALPAMKAADGGKGWGRIINVASAHGLVGSPEKSAYVAAKHGVVGPDQGNRAGKRHHRRDLQRHLPRLGADPAGAKAGGRQSHRARHHQRSCHQTTAG